MSERLFGRPSLFGPPGYVRIERYTLTFTRLPSFNPDVAVFEASPDIPFLIDKLIYAAGLPVSKWHTFFLRYFSWVCYPHVTLDVYDRYEQEETEDDEDDAKGFRVGPLRGGTLPFNSLGRPRVERRLNLFWRRPVIEAVGRSQTRAQRKAVMSCVVHSILANRVELLVSPVPLQMFDSVAVGTGFYGVPAVPPGRSIRITTSAIAAPLTFSMIGRTQPMMNDGGGI